MTTPPPPPPGGYPPPQGYPGYPPPPPPPAWRLPKEAYTPWSARLLAFLIDWTPIWLAFVVPVIGLLIAGDTECIDSMYGSGGGYCATPESDLWLSVQALTFLLAAVYFFWNFCYRQGKTGQSIGKSAMKFRVISEKTWQPIGFWLSLVRQIAHYRGPTHLLHRLSVSAVGRQASDDRRQAREHSLCAGEPAATYGTTYPVLMRFIGRR